MHISQVDMSISNQKTALQILDTAGLAKFLEMQEDIPLLKGLPANVSLKDGVVIRVRGMVQDTLDGVIKHKKCGDYDLRYRQGVEEVPNCESLSFSDSYYDVDRYTVVSVPGLCSSVDDVLLPSNICEPKHVQEKVETLSPSVNLSDEPPALVPVETELTEKSTIDPHPESQLGVGEGRFSLVANVTRDSSEAMTQFKLHQLVEIIGLVSKSTGDDSLPGVNFNMQVLSMNELVSPIAEKSDNEAINQGRSLILGNLTRIFNGDILSAEYMLLQLISNRYNSAVVPTLGSWALNISNSDSVNISELENFLRDVLADPLVVLPCSNSNLLAHKFYPQREDSNEFTSPGVLQLSSKTVAIFDERLLQEGNVNALNILAITKLVRDQELMGLFGNQVVNFPMDIKTIILTKQGHSIFTPANPAQGISGNVPIAHVPLVSAPADQPRKLSETERTICRAYIQQCQEMITNVTIPDTVVEQFENDWVNSRKIDENIPTDDIHIWATLLRAMPASRCATEVDPSHWNAVMMLESQRRIRISENSETDTRIAVNGA